MSHSSERPCGSEGDRKDLQENSREQDQTIFLDPWLYAKGDPLAAVVEDLMSVTKPDSRNRIRSERRDAFRNRHLCVSNITANLALLALSPNREPGSLLAISTAKTKPTRYDREDYPQGILAKTIEAMEAAGLLTRHSYVCKQRSTTVEPTSGFVAMLERRGARLLDIGREAGGETIWLSARKPDEGEGQRGRRRPAKCLVSYADTEETIRLRAEVERINAFLDDAGIAFDGEPTGPVALRRMFLLRSPTDAVTFDLNGRLAGGFWQNLRADQRHLITIDGEGIADLDFKSMFATLAYLRATGSLPEGDPYDIPGLEEHRKGAKLALLSLLARSNGMRRLAPELRAALPEDWTAKRLVEAMTRRHSAIARLWGKDIGIELMNTESRILMAVLLELETKGIPALPMHDGVNVRVSDRAAALETMQAVSGRLLDVALPVAEKPLLRPPRAAKAA